MEVQFTPEQDAQLSQIATHAGTPTAEVVKNPALRLVEETARFRAAVREGIAQAESVALTNHDRAKPGLPPRFRIEAPASPTGRNGNHHHRPGK